MDSDGFDRRKAFLRGEYRGEIELPKGLRLCRYGNDRGIYTARVEVKYEELSLPYDLNSIEYHEYEVIADGLKVRCVVIGGYVAPAFDSAGGAVQYMHFRQIRQEVRSGYLMEVTEWFQQKKKDAWIH